MLIGRKQESLELREALQKEESQFIAVYGRRRVGKTFLIREAYNYEFAFQFTGAPNLTSRQQLVRFRSTLREYGHKAPELTNWVDAFFELKMFLKGLPDGKKVIFIDELPWIDTTHSGFLSELETFWNGWATTRKDIVLIVCGSSTSWMVKKILHNKGGLHNRLTGRIHLRPFTLKYCEQMANHMSLGLTRMQVLDLYMVFGGVPYYWSLLKAHNSVTQEVDRLVFDENGALHDEYEMLYASLFKSPENYLKVIEALAQKKTGLTRSEIIDAAQLQENGHLTQILQDLEWCGFIRKYHSIGSHGLIYQLIDHFTIFHHEFLRNRHAFAKYWEAIQDNSLHKTWHGLAFERVCLGHVDQIKAALGISGVYTETYAWKADGDKEKKTQGAQIDLVLQRKDGIIDLCEIKYSQKPYPLSLEYVDDLAVKRAVFSETTRTKNAVHTIMITTRGLADNPQARMFQQVILDDLFE